MVLLRYSINVTCIYFENPPSSFDNRNIKMQWQEHCPRIRRHNLHNLRSIRALLLWVSQIHSPRKDGLLLDKEPSPSSNRSTSLWAMLQTYLAIPFPFKLFLKLSDFFLKFFDQLIWCSIFSFFIF